GSGRKTKAHTSAPRTAMTRIGILLRLLTAPTPLAPGEVPLATLRHRHGLDLCRRRGPAALPAPLPEDEERRREHDRRSSDEDVEPDAADLVRRADRHRL